MTDWEKVYRYKTGKITFIFNNPTENETFYTMALVDRKSGDPVSLEIEITEIHFSVIEFEKTNTNEYNCKVIQDRRNLNKLKRQFSKLYKKVEKYVKDEFYSLVKKTHPELLDKVSEVINNKSIDTSILEKMMSIVPLNVVFTILERDK